jgi:serine/threonine-protein kinase
MPLLPGRLVTESLRLVRLLGKGGMGSVWVADHLALHTQVAVKFMSAAAVEDPTLVSRFEREASAAAQIKSPHVVQTLDHGMMSPEGVPFIVMELLEGEDLASRLKRFGPTPMSEVLAVLGQAGKALAKAHAAGIIHRDIKPDNLFLLDGDGDLFVKVLDFGVAKQASDVSLGMTSTGSTVGTPHYMSPEQLLSAKHIDQRCDLWALSVVAYRMLTGRLPFRGETLGALSVALHQGFFQPPSTFRPDLGPAVDAWFARALHREIDARFATVKELVEALEQAARAPLPAALAAPLPGEALTYMPTPSLGASPARELTPAPAFAPTPSPAPSPDPARPPSFAGSAVTQAGRSRPRAPLLLLAGSLAFLALSGGLAFFLLYRAVVSPASAASSAAPTASGPALVASPPPVEAPSANVVASVEPSATVAPTASAAALPSATPAPKAAAPLLPRKKERDRGF